MPFISKPALLPIKTPTPLEVAWAAGVYEGEGCCPKPTSGSRKWKSAQATVVQKDPEILYKLKDFFGGSIRLMRCKSLPADKQAQVLAISGNNARLFLAQIYPWLSTRRKFQIDQTGAFAFLNGDSPDSISFEEVRARLHAFDLARYKGGITPEEQRAYKNKQRNIRRRKVTMNIKSEKQNSAQERVM